MRKFYLMLLVVAVAVGACDTKDPKDPGAVTITGPSPFTTTTTTSTTTTSTTSVPPTTSVPFATARTYFAFGPTAPHVPNVLSLNLKQSSPAPTFEVLGSYQTPSGAGGAVRGTLVGTLDNGTFTGTLTGITPECTAERQYSGTVNSLELRFTGGTTLHECKGTPLSFNSLNMLASQAPPPTAPPPLVTSTIPLTCSYSLGTGLTSFGAGGGSGSVELITGGQCAWTVQRFVDWVTVQPVAGTGPARVTYTVAPNGGAPRSTTIVIAGQPWVINQSNVP
jgi:hypothetical protein